MLSDEEFRSRLRAILERSGLSQRALSAAFGRDPGYVQSLLDPTRPSRARPSPADLIRCSDATGIGFVELLEVLWDIRPARLAQELGAQHPGHPTDDAWPELDPGEQKSVSDYIAFLVARHHSRRRRGRSARTKGT